MNYLWMILDSHIDSFLREKNSNFSTLQDKEKEEKILISELLIPYYYIYSLSTQIII